MRSVLRPPHIPLLLRDTYLAMVKNSIGTKMFRHSFALVAGKKKDILQNKGLPHRLSCGFFVSSVLLIFNLIHEPHTSVEGTISDMEQSGWKKISSPKIGCILVWEKDKDDNRHIGFYVGNKKAISHNPDKGAPKIHHFTYGAKNGKPVQKTEAIYWHKKLT